MFDMFVLLCVLNEVDYLIVWVCDVYLQILSYVWCIDFMCVAYMCVCVTGVWSCNFDGCAQTSIFGLRSLCRNWKDATKLHPTLLCAY